jgi:iron(III) transport system ATP-binding protein
MAMITLEHITKVFGNDVIAVDDVSLEIRDGEFMVLVGPSGCGKSTILRILAGLEEVTAGEVLVGDQQVTDLPPKERDVAMVFQNYALYPHMTVEQNLGFGLRLRKTAKDETKRRVDDVAKILGLEPFMERKPAALSGGQRQRVALARCLVTEPSLVLLDEPLANLDVHLRAAMEDEFARFHARTGTTMVYITHDQAEAMALADRIAVMDRGLLLQVATPSQLYREPADETVAGFIGEGMVVPAEVQSVNGDGTCWTDIFGHGVRMRCAASQKAKPGARACLRASELRIVDATDAGIRVRVDRAIYQGGFFRLETHVEGQPEVLLHLTAPEPFQFAPDAAIQLRVADGWVIPAPAKD